MKFMNTLIILLIFAGISCQEHGGNMFIDQYLQNWDQFAQGNNSLTPYLKENKNKFESELTQLLLSGDKRTPAKVVFYMVVQIGGGIPCDSDLGKAWAKVIDPNFPVTTSEEGEKLYFAGDLYIWWENNKDKYDSFQLFDEWCNRDFAKQTIIPMYHSVMQKENDN